MMKCPVCGKEMEPGHLQTMQRIAWVKDLHKLSLLPKSGEIMLANYMMKSVHFQAWLCRDCQEIVFHYDKDKKGYQEKD